MYEREIWIVDPLGSVDVDELEMVGGELEIV